MMSALFFQHSYFTINLFFHHSKQKPYKTDKFRFNHVKSFYRIYIYLDLYLKKPHEIFGKSENENLLYTQNLCGFHPTTLFIFNSKLFLDQVYKKKTLTFYSISSKLNHTPLVSSNIILFGVILSGRFVFSFNVTLYLSKIWARPNFPSNIPNLLPKNTKFHL